MKKRAGDLRECARQARTLAKRLGPYLDSSAKQAQQSAPAIWKGPYATSATAQISDRKGKLNRMADALMNDAARWEAEARRLDEQAAGEDKKNKGGG
ncbi:hypothetical protein [Streptomyces telluris]|uniref:Uncharacterized protein n=1 Tax=Streptomyces telluris TaxID=2720021 RepID=A0A9X2LDK6_9ACTN|nr:hypothetical protein [Streptomyces telluris]MCQ8769203.1 hypothetical protein [Streptomyces telluris]